MADAKMMVLEALRNTLQDGDMDFREVVDKLATRSPKAAKVLEEVEADALTFLAFPAEHRRRLQSTKLLERLNREIKRLANVVGIFPNSNASIGLPAAILIERHEEWSVGRAYLDPEPIAALYGRHVEEKEGVSKESVA